MIKKIICVSIICICLIAGGLMIYHTQTSAYQEDADQVRSENEEESEGATAAESEVLVTDTPVVLTEEDAQKILDDCRETGQRIADLQNEYTDPDLSDGDKRLIFEDLKANYLLGSTTQWIWYAPDLTINFTWEFVTPYEISSDGTIEGIWLCKNDAGELLAYALATYTDGHFIDADGHQTSLGSDAVGTYADRHGETYEP